MTFESLLSLRTPAHLFAGHALFRGALGGLSLGGVRGVGGRAGGGLLRASAPLGRRAEPAADALGFRLGRWLGAGFGLRARVEFAARELHLRDLGAVAAAIPEAQQPRVAARPLGKPRREGVEQLGHDGAVLQILHDAAARVEKVAVGGGSAFPGGVRPLGGDAALGNRNQPLDKRPELLGARHRRGEVLVPEQGRRLVPQHGDAMLGDATELPVCNSMSHGSFWAWWVGWAWWVRWETPPGLPALPDLPALSSFLRRRGRL